MNIGFEKRIGLTEDEREHLLEEDLEAGGGRHGADGGEDDVEERVGLYKR